MKFHWLNREQWLWNEQIGQIYFSKDTARGSERNLWCNAAVSLFDAAAVEVKEVQESSAQGLWKWKRRCRRSERRPLEKARAFTKQCFGWYIFGGISVNIKQKTFSPSN